MAGDHPPDGAGDDGCAAGDRGTITARPSRPAGSSGGRLAPEADADADTDAPGDPAAEADGDATGEGVTATDGAGVTGGAGSGANARIPPSRSAATAIPATRPTTIERRAHIVARRVPVRAARGVVPGRALAFGSDVRPLGARAHAPLPGAPHRGRRDAARGRSAVVHDAGRRGARSEPRRPTPATTLAPTDAAAHHAAAARVGRPAQRDADSRPRPGRDTRRASPRSTSTCPIVKGPDGYPLCNVAMYLERARPARPGPARPTSTPTPATGMFLPLLETSKAKAAARAWSSRSGRATTSDSSTRSPRSGATSGTSTTRSAPTTEQLWLQTSEGPKGTPGKTQVVAEPLSVERADHADAHPKAKPVDCG